MAIIERQLIFFFIDGLCQDYLKMKVLRDNPASFQAAVTGAMNEQNLRTRFHTRLDSSSKTQSQTTHQPMEIDHYRPRKPCSYCFKPGHNIKEYRSRQRHINVVEKGYQNRPWKDKTSRNDWKNTWTAGIVRLKATFIRMPQQTK